MSDSYAQYEQSCWEHNDGHRMPSPTGTFARCCPVAHSRYIFSTFTSTTSALPLCSRWKTKSAVIAARRSSIPRATGFDEILAWYSATVTGAGRWYSNGARQSGPCVRVRPGVRFGAGGLTPHRCLLTLLSHNLPNHSTAGVGQAPVPAGVVVSQPYIVQAHQVQDGRMDIAHVINILHRFESEIIRGADKRPAFMPPPAIQIVIACVL